jgi:hypothetical protein
MGNAMKTMLGAALALSLGAGALPADEVKGKIKKVDADKKLIIVTIGDKDQELNITSETKLLAPNGKNLKDGIESKRLKAAAEVTVVCEKKDGKDVCVQIQLVAKPAELKPGELTGKIKKVDADKNLIVVTIGDKDQELKVTAETKLLGPNGKDLKDGIQNARLKEEAQVIVACEKKDGKEVCTKIQLKGQRNDN